MNSQSLPSKFLTSRWDRVKCRDHPRKYWLVKDLDLQGKDLAVKLIRESVVKRECGQFETALKDKLSLTNA